MNARAALVEMQCPSGLAFISIFHTCHGGSRLKLHCLNVGRVCSAQPEEKEHGAVILRVGDRELSQRVPANNFYWHWLSLLTTSPLAVELQKFARKNCLERLRARDLTSGQVFSCIPQPQATRPRESISPWASRYTCE